MDAGDTSEMSEGALVGADHSCWDGESHLSKFPVLQPALAMANTGCYVTWGRKQNPHCSCGPAVNQKRGNLMCASAPFPLRAAAAVPVTGTEPRGWSACARPRPLLAPRPHSVTHCLVQSSLWQDQRPGLTPPTLTTADCQVQNPSLRQQRSFL
ncbi:hypothetical protein AAFF_G00374370 [Aldrovandia affinis]|uniref:Uncharacterized protein n=1 Tax=Aldrovandia affinis TaxID=143900 RepID=A0AAD7SI40_9TELE|nr:hypothetical protein AAFF_G00374370 [Aldrovandia affinis]